MLFRSLKIDRHLKDKKDKTAIIWVGDDPKDVYVYITHAVLSGDAVKKIEKSQIKKLITTDTIDNSKKIKNSKKIETKDKKKK